MGRVVAIAPTTLADPHLEAWLDHWEALARSDVGADALNLGLLLPAFAPAAFARAAPAVRRDMVRHPLARATVLRYIACDRAQDLRPHLGRVDASVLVIGGAEDALTGRSGAESVAAAIAGARLEIVAGAGHSPHLERPDRVAELIGGHLP